MPITKREPHYKTPQNLIEYILDDKNYGEKVGVASSINCNVETALLEFKDIQKKYQMKGKRVAYHIIQSFSPKDKLTCKQANEIGKRLCEELYPDFQCIISTHIDKGHLHNHIAVNSINLDGRKLDDRLANNKEGLYALSDTSDRISAEYGCFIMPRKTYLKLKNKDYYYQYKEQSYKEKIKDDVETIIPRCASLEEFLDELSILGYEVKRGKNIAVRTTGMERFARLSTIDKNFSEKNLYMYFKNQNNLKLLAIKTGKNEFNSRVFDNALESKQAVELSQASIEGKIYNEYQKTKYQEIKRYYELKKQLEYLDKYNIQSFDDIENKIEILRSQIKSKNIELKRNKEEFDKIIQITEKAQDYIRLYEVYEYAKTYKEMDEKYIMIKLFSLFSGIGAFEKALERMKIPYELVGFSEIDKFAIKSYCAIHNVSEDKNFGDITKIDISKLPDFDLMTWGFPCQDISIAGKMKGIREGETRSGLYYEGYKILKEKRPKISIIENVKNLTSKRFKSQFDSILEDLSDLGYTNYWQVLNSKDYGIPQNRERVFIISIRNDVAKGNFKFPLKRTLKLKLKDILEEQVEEKYYLSDKAIGRLIRKNNRLIRNKENPDVSACIIAGYHKMDGRNNQYIAENNKIERVGGIYDTNSTKHQAGSIYNPNGISPTLTTMSKGGNKQPFVLVEEGTIKGYAEARKGDSINYSYPNNLKKRGRVGKELSQTILTSPNIAVLENIDKPICINNSRNKLSIQDRIYDSNGIYTTLTAGGFKPKIAEIKMFNPYNNKELKDIAPTQTTNCGSISSSAAVLVSEDGETFMKIRRLTPLECWRLMEFDDDDFYKAKNAGVSNTQLYRQAGNSIVVNVLENILYELFYEELMDKCG